MRVHQLLAALSYGDAIGNEALAIQRQLRAAGYESDIFAEMVHPRVAHLARPLWEYQKVSSPETVCIFHFSIGSTAVRAKPASASSRRLNSLSPSASSVRAAKARSSRRP